MDGGNRFFFSHATLTLNSFWPLKISCYRIFDRNNSSFEVISCKIRAQQCSFQLFNGQNSIREATMINKPQISLSFCKRKKKTYTQIPRPHIQKKNRDKFNNNWLKTRVYIIICQIKWSILQDDPGAIKRQNNCFQRFFHRWKSNIETAPNPNLELNAIRVEY